MRKVAALDEQRHADRLAGYLLTLGISGRVLEEPEGWTVWIHDEEQIERARDEVEQFLDDPNDPIYAQAAEHAEAVLRENRKVAKRLQKARTATQQRAFGRSPVQTIPLTLGLIILSVLVTALSNFGDKVEGVRAALSITDLKPADEPGMVEFLPGLNEIRQGQVWRLITPIFIHLDFIHLLFNMIMCYQLARAVETLEGTWRLAALAVGVAIFSNLMQYFVPEPLDFLMYWTGFSGQEPRPSAGGAGMSGVLYGLFGYIWMRWRFDPFSGYYMPAQTVFIMLAWYVVCWTGFIPIGNMAHTAGLVLGVAVGYTLARWRPRPR